MPTTDNIHRYLDEAFAGIPRTPESADLKEEIRGNLQARVAELEATGTKPEAAAAKAIRELGPIQDLVDSIGPDEASGRPVDTAVKLMALNRVKLSPFYVVRAVLLSLLLAAGVVLVVLGAFHVLAWSVTALAIFATVAGAFEGLIVGDAVSHETSQHYPMPAARAAGFGAAGFVGLTGLGLAAIYLGHVGAVWLLVTGCALALVSLVAFIALGVTQTNRQKPWVKEMNNAYAIEDRFSQDPAAAARFGIYTVVIWIAGFGLFALLSIVVGFVWSWLALLAALLVFFLVLARMLFAVDPTKKGAINK
jgi:hypothetical protein